MEKSVAILLRIMFERISEEMIEGPRNQETGSQEFPMQLLVSGQ